MNKEALSSEIFDYLDKLFINDDIFCYSMQISQQLKLEHDAVVGVLKSFESRKQLELCDPVEKVSWRLTDEGINYLTKGTPEWNLLTVLSETSNGVLSLQEVSKLKDSKIALRAAIQYKWIILDTASSKLIRLTEKGQLVKQDIIQSFLSCLNECNKLDLPEKEVFDSLNNNVSSNKCCTFTEASQVLKELRNRKLILSKRITVYKIKKGIEFNRNAESTATDLTRVMVLTGSWATQNFKSYNFKAYGLQPARGSVHPLMRMMQEMKKIFFFMGFDEMPTNRWVEASFWNFDALFQPQLHPARDIQDTFYLKNPDKSVPKFIPMDYLKRVKTMHESGGYGSRGWRYIWSEEESYKNILRTHTTACTAQTLYSLAQRLKEYPDSRELRYFSIDRVFRNEAVDATHLSEFHQIEGCVFGRNLSLVDLKGYLSTFYKAIGITDLRFKPTFNPYTEPSMEVFGYHKEQKEWLEVGNSGIFRPELLIPMEFPPDVTVLGWGLSLERPTMIRYGVSDIRQLFGHKAKIGVAC